MMSELMVLIVAGLFVTIFVIVGMALGLRSTNEDKTKVKRD